MAVPTEDEMRQAMIAVSEAAREMWRLQKENALLRRFIGVHKGPCADCDSRTEDVGFDGEAVICIDRAACSMRKARLGSAYYNEGHYVPSKGAAR